MACVLGLDIGTTSTIGILIRLPGEVMGIVSRPMTLSAPQPGWAEEDPRQWWTNVCAILAEFRDRGFDLDTIEAIGVTGMLPAVVLLDRDGELIRPSIQQSDARCGAEVRDLASEIDGDDFVRRAGNGINQQLVICKLRWLEKHEPEAFSRIATVFGSYDYINWRLTGERAVEQNWALEGGFVDLAKDAVADDLVALAHIPRDALPPKSRSHAVLGKVSAQAAADTGLKAGMPVVGGAADLIASALAAGLTRRGDTLLKFGGSVDVLVAADRAEPDPRMYLDYHLVPGLFVPNGCMATGGSGLNWFVGTFGGGEAGAAAEAGITIHARLDALAADLPAGADGVTVLPYFLGEKTPIHDPAARAVFSGISFSHGLGHMWRALLESYGYAIAHHVEVLNDIGHATDTYIACDGGSKSVVWMQIVSDILQRPIQLLEGHPGSCLGAAWTAAMGTGLADDWSDISRFVSNGPRIEPNPANAAVYEEGYRRYRDLYPRLFAAEAGQ
ncbi:MAG: FGGY-family carbohydrate kinase [Bauldia litoralis]